MGGGQGLRGGTDGGQGTLKGMVSYQDDGNVSEGHRGHGRTTL